MSGVLGYVCLGRAKECFGVLADQAQPEYWGNVAYLAVVVTETRRPPPHAD